MPVVPTAAALPLKAAKFDGGVALAQYHNLPRPYRCVGKRYDAKKARRPEDSLKRPGKRGTVMTPVRLFKAASRQSAHDFPEAEKFLGSRHR